MKYFFIHGPDIGYRDMGLFQNQYTALIFARDICKKAVPGRRYQLVDNDGKPVANITAGVNPKHEWIGGRN